MKSYEITPAYRVYTKSKRADAININGQELSFKDAESRILKIKNEYQGHTNSLSGDDLMFIGSLLLSRKYNVAEDLEIKLMRSGQTVTDSLRDYCFFYRTDTGELDDFSVNKAMNSANANKNVRLTHVFRCEVWISDIQPLRLKRGASFYEHVDHMFPFMALLEIFLERENLSLKHDIQFYELPIDHWCRWKLVDTDLADRWRVFHKQHSKLRIVPDKENLSKGGVDKATIHRIRELILKK